MHIYASLSFFVVVVVVMSIPDVTADGHLSFSFVVFTPASFFYVVLFQSGLDQPKLFSAWARNKNIYFILIVK